MDENYEVNEVETTEEVEKSSNDLIGKIALVGAGLLLGKLVSPIIDKGVKKVKKKAKKAKSNLIYQFKKANNRLPQSKIELPGTITSVTERRETWKN